MKTIVASVKSMEDASIYEYKLEEATVCPICKHAISPTLINGIYSEREDYGHIWLFNYCVACKTPFISKYSTDIFDYTGIYHYQGSFPSIYKPSSHDTFIETMSPRYYNILHQAEEAESLRLDEIAGVGYRKAVEILVKDYVVSLDLNAKKEILDEPLGQCIEKRIENKDIKKLAKRCAWLGNDEVHYYRKHEGKDVEDLKELIEALVYFIKMNQIFERSLEIEPGGKKK